MRRWALVAIAVLELLVGSARAATIRQIEAQEELLARRAEASLRSFYRQQFKIVERLQPRVDNWHVDAICDHLQATVADVDVTPQITRLVINVPPRNSKSSTTCVALPAWTWGPRKLPGRRFIYITHALKLARRDSVGTRRVITSPWYRTYWGDRFQLVGDQNAKDRFENDQTGYRMIGSFHGGSVVGEGADFLGIDDPIDPDEWDNPNELERIVETFDTGIVGRLNDQVRGVIVIIMQRLAEGDLCGHVLKQAGWQHLRLPAEFELEDRCRTFVYVKREDVTCPAPESSINNEAGAGDVTPAVAATADVRLSTTAGQPAPIALAEQAGGSDRPGYARVLFFEDPRTEEGELLNPKRFPREALDRLRTNEWVYAAQQQQRPTPRGGQILQAGWWRFYDAKPHDAEGKPLRPDHGAQSWDLAFKDLRTSDYVAALAGELYGADIYITDYWMERASFTATCDQMRQWDSQPHLGGLDAKLVEDKANGPAVADALAREIAGIVLVDPRGGKVARAFAAQPTLKAGNVFLPNPKDPATGRDRPELAWVRRFIKNCADFPKGLHDDDVDAFTQLVTYLRGTHSSMLEYLKQLKARDAAKQEGGRA